MSSRTKRILSGLAISGAALIVAFGAAELLARANEAGPFSFFDCNPYHRDERLDHIHRPGFEGRWDGTWYEINAHGERGPERTPTFAAGELRLLAIGDSCTFGKGVGEAECWPRQLETLLRGDAAPSASILVVNAGVNSYSGAQYHEVLKRKAAELRPQVVVIGYSLNDFPNVMQKVDRAVFQGKSSLRGMVPAKLRDSLGRLALFRWMRATYYELNRERDWKASEKLAREVGDLADKQERRFDEECERLKAIVDTAQRAGAAVCFLLFPYESQVYVEIFETAPIERLRLACKDLGVAFVDLAEEFRRAAAHSDPPVRLFLRGDRYHPSAEGYAIVARSVLRAIRDHGWLAPDH